MNWKSFDPTQVVMISSTTLDLPKHRKMVEDAIFRAGMHPEAMEYSSAQSDSNSIKFSLEMVDRAQVYVGVFGHRYGYIPEDSERNPESRSVTELEYRYAKRIGKPVLVFIMGDEHPIFAKDKDEGVKLKKLRALKKELLKHEIIALFDSPELLRTLVLQALNEWRKKQPSEDQEPPDKTALKRDHSIIPRPPNLFTLSQYVVGTEFVGRRSELRDLDEWARLPDTIMAIEAIGGLGKSAIAWEWLKNRAYQTLPQIAGAVWWNFEKHNSIRSMVVHTLGYIRGENPREIRGSATELMEQLAFELRRRPFLLVMDGLERVLTAYHSLDAAQIVDEAVAVRLRDTTDPADNEILKTLVSISPSKVLITTRLMPSALESRTGTPLPGVHLVELKGLRPEDALNLMQDLGVHGDPVEMLKLCEQFGNHSLLIGVISGLILDYRRAPGDFGMWRADPRAGGDLHLSELDLINGRAHILKYAIDSLEESKRRLLSRIAVYSESIDYAAIEAVSPYVPTKENGKPQDLTDEELRAADAALDVALSELEDRRLLKWDRPSNTYDLHPVVRGYAFDLLDQEEKGKAFDRVRDHFYKLPPEQTETATDVSDLKTRISIFRALVGAKKFEDAVNLYLGEFSYALVQNLSAGAVIVEMLMPVYEAILQNPECISSAYSRGYVMNDLAIAHNLLGQVESAKTILSEAIRIDISADLGPANLAVHMRNFADAMTSIRSEFLLRSWVYKILSEATTDVENLNRSRLNLAGLYRKMGRYDEADAILDEIEPIEKPTRAVYTKSMLELERLRVKRGYKKVRLEDLEKIRALVKEDQGSQKDFYNLYGEVALDSEKPALAIEAFQEAIALRRKSGLSDDYLQTRLALALAMTGQTLQAKKILDSLMEKKYFGYSLAEVFLSVNDKKQAEYFARAGYAAAWGDGPPYQNHEQLSRMANVLNELGVPLPHMKKVKVSELEGIPQEEEIKAYIERYSRKSRLERQIQKTLDQAKDRGFEWVFEQLAAMRELTDPYSNEPALRQTLARTITDTMRECKSATACDGLTIALAHLEDLYSTYPGDDKIREALSSGLSTTLAHHAMQGAFAEVNEMLARQQKLAAQAPKEGREWVDLAWSYSATLFYAGRERRFEEVDRSLKELFILTKGPHGQPEIRAARSSALRSAVAMYGEAGRLQEVTRCLADLESLASDHTEEAQLRHDFARSLANASYDYGVARQFGEVNRCERLVTRLRERFPNEPQLKLALTGVYGNAAIRLAAARCWEDAEDKLGKAQNLMEQDQPDTEVNDYIAWCLSGVAMYFAWAMFYEKAQKILAELEEMARHSPEDANIWPSLGASFYGIAWYRGLIGDLNGMDAWVEQLEGLTRRLEGETDLDLYLLRAHAVRIAFCLMRDTEGVSIQDLAETADALEQATQGKPEFLQRGALEILALRELFGRQPDGVIKHIKEWRRLGGSWWETEIGFALAALVSDDIGRAKNHLEGALIEVRDSEDLEWYAQVLRYLHRDKSWRDESIDLDEMVQTRMAELAKASSIADSVS